MRSNCIKNLHFSETTNIGGSFYIAGGWLQVVLLRGRWMRHYCIKDIKEVVKKKFLNYANSRNGITAKSNNSLLIYECFLLCSHCFLTLQTLFPYFAVIVSILCNHNFLSLQTLFLCIAITVSLLCNNCFLTSQQLFPYFAIIVSLNFKHCFLTLQRLFPYFAIIVFLLCKYCSLLCKDCFLTLQLLFSYFANIVPYFAIIVSLYLAIIFYIF
jgi:hypothetical protein